MNGPLPTLASMIATVTLNPSLDEWMQLPTLRLGALNRASGFSRYPGGKGINVSRVIRELGGRTVAFALAGGEDGLILRSAMNRLGIPHEFVTINGSTRNNYKIRNTHPPALTEINLTGPEVSRPSLSSLLRRLLSHRPRPRCVVLSGSLPPGAPVTIYREWIAACHRRSMPVVLDASGAAFTTGLTARPWLIKPNRQEAEECMGRRLARTSEIVKAAVALLRRGPSVVVLSLGAKGAVLASASPRGVWMARPPIVNVDSAVGAGDSLVGGWLVGWQRRSQLLDAFRWGIASGTAAAMTPGTELCHRTDVRRLMSQVEIRRIG